MKIDIDGTIYQDVGVRDGPVDATYKIIKRLVKTNSHLPSSPLTYNARHGRPRRGFCCLEEEGYTVIGKGNGIRISL